MNDRTLMALRADVLFAYDARGRMVARNDPEARPAPRLFLGCTADGQVIRFGQDVPDDVAEQLTVIVERQPAVDALVPGAALAVLREALARLAPGAREQLDPAAAEDGGPAYRFPEVVARPRVEGHVVQVTRDTIDVVRDTYPWLVQELEDWAPCFAVARDGAAVSVCFTSRIGPRAVEAGVETLPDFRGHGYATAATCAWGAHVAAGGRIPIYSTGWGNLASQGVARRAGLVLFGADASLP